MPRGRRKMDEDHEKMMPSQRYVVSSKMMPSQRYVVSSKMMPSQR